MTERMITEFTCRPALCSPHLGAKGLGLSLTASLPLPLISWQPSRIISKKETLGRVNCVLQEELAPAPTPQSTERTQYKDSWIEKKAINFLTNRIERLTGKRTELKDYDGFVDMTRQMVHNLPATKQRDTVHKLLHVVLPDWLLLTFRLIPKTKWTIEFYAVFTTVFFTWLVGESEIREGEVKGQMIKNTVHIKKCRYLESSQCVGLCVNLCKNPTQGFIGKQFGMPLTMNPNFEDMSCDMIYGLQPPALEDDEAYKQPCYTLCKTAKQKPNCA